MDVTPLRRARDFRLLWTGQAVSFVGTMMTVVALPFQVYALTRSSLAVGLLGVAELVPLVVGGLVGGAVADARERRSVLLAAVTGSALASAVLLAVSVGGRPPLAALYVLAAAAALCGAVSQATTRALVPMVVAVAERPAAFALDGVYGTFGMLAGPALAGALIAVDGPRLAYAVDVASFAVALATFARLGAHPPAPDAVPASLGSVLDGLRFVRGRPLILGTFWVDLVAMVFGMPRALFPALALRLGAGPAGYGLLHASVAAGAFALSVSSGWAGRVRRQGAAVLAAVGVWGGAIVGVGLARSLVAACLLLAVAGGADMVSGIFRSTITAAATPDALRGRVVGLEWVVVATGPLVGDAESGLAAALIGVPAAIASGGVLCLAGAGLLAVALPAFRRYRAGSPVAPGGEPPAGGPGRDYLSSQ